VTKGFDATLANLPFLVFDFHSGAHLWAPESLKVNNTKNYG